MSREERLAALESLAAETAKALALHRAENKKLAARVSSLDEENKLLRLERRQFEAMSRRQEHLRERLERAVKKIDRVLESAG